MSELSVKILKRKDFPPISTPIGGEEFIFLAILERLWILVVFYMEAWEKLWDRNPETTAVLTWRPFQLFLNILGCHSNEQNQKKVGTHRTNHKSCPTHYSNLIIHILVEVNKSLLSINAQSHFSWLLYCYLS